MSDHVTGLRCLYCGETYPDEPRYYGCPACRTDEFVSNVAPTYDYDALAGVLDRETLDARGPGVWAVPELLPVDADHAVSLGEGATPLVECGSLGEAWGVPNLHLKDESQNPTWSYKDRLCSVALSKAREVGADVATIASTGNHGASTAAYAARAGLDAVIFTIPSVPATMKTQMQVHGAAVVATPTHEDRWTLMRACVEAFDWFPTGSYVYPPVGSNPYGIEGYKSLAYEVCRDLGWEAPDWVVQPTAYADGLSGIWRGFQDLHALGVIDHPPRMVAVEPFGPLAHALDEGLDRQVPVETGETVAFSIGAGISTYQGLAALRESGGTAVRSADEDLRSLQRRLGEEVGLYGEAAAVAALAGVRTLAEDGTIDPDETVVAVHTSTGLKDTEMTAEGLPDVPTVEPEVDALRRALAETYGVDI